MNKLRNKSSSRVHRTVSFLWWTVIILLITACGKNHLHLAEDMQRNKNYEEALNHYLQALKDRPEDIDLRIDIDRLLKEASRYYHYLGREQERMKKPEMAVYLYQKSLEFDPANNRSRQSLSLLINNGKETRTLAAIKKEMEINVGMPAVFKDKETINLDFRSKVSLKRIFETLAKTAEVNILLDAGFRDRRVSLSLRENTFQQALERLCTLFNCCYYILDDHNIIVTPDNADSRKRFKRLIMKNLFFSNIEAQEAKQVIESVVRPEKLIVNKKTNSLIAADSPRNIALIEKLAQFIDKRRGEVAIEVEILEVDRKRLQDYGTELSSYQIGVEVDGFTEGKRYNDLFYLGGDDVILTMPRAVWKFYSSATQTKLLAQPNVRGLDREKMEIKLGEKRPILRTTFVSSSGGGTQDQPVASYDMKDVGISVTITPQIHHNREITVSLNFELTYVTDPGGGYLPPTLGNRKVTTTLRLRDGETGIIAGLMRGISTEGTDGIPILSSIPIIKEVFSSRTRTRERTDVLISITPRILRMPAITRSDLEAYLIGTDQKVELKKWRSEQPSAGKSGDKIDKKTEETEGKRTEDL
jgi:general secretion pathway protein D